MRRALVDYRQACEAAARNYLETSDRFFLKRESIGQAIDLTGRALDRVIISLIEARVLARFHLVMEDGEPSDIKVYGIMPRALQYRGLAFMPRRGGGYVLSEASSDVVACYVSQRDAREDASQVRIRSLLSSACDPVTAALFPALRARQTRQTATSHVTA